MNFRNYQTVARKELKYEFEIEFRWLIDFVFQVSATIRTMLTELNKDIEKLSSDLSTQSRNGVM